MNEQDGVLELSIVVCTYNGEGDITECIESLLDQQLDTDYEIIVVDDGSTDSTPNRLRSFDSDRLSIIRKEKNEGLSAARNTGWKNASGAVVAYIDDDAVAPEDWAKRILKQYADDVDGVGGYAESYYDDVYGAYNVGRMKYIYGPNAERVDGAGGMNMSFKITSLSDIGGFDEGFRHIGDDADLNRRMVENGMNLVVDPSITIVHKFSNSFVDFCQAKFNRGLGDAIMNMKYNETNMARILLEGLLSPLGAPVAAYEAYGIRKYTQRGNLLSLFVLSYFHFVCYRVGILYYSLTDEYSSSDT